MSKRFWTLFQRMVIVHTSDGRIRKFIKEDISHLSTSIGSDT